MHVNRPYPWRTLPEPPTACLQYVNPQSKVRYRMGKDTLSNAFGSIQEQAVSQTGHDTRQNQMMLQTEKNGPDNQGAQAVGSDSDRGEIGIYNIAQ